MFSGRLTHATVRFLDRMAGLLPNQEDGPAHLQTGRRGEEDAYFYLRRRGYVMVARNFRSPRRQLAGMGITNVHARLNDGYVSVRARRRRSRGS